MIKFSWLSDAPLGDMSHWKIPMTHHYGVGILTCVHLPEEAPISYFDPQTLDFGKSLILRYKLT